jgi:hypothetical protein
MVVCLIVYGKRNIKNCGFYVKTILRILLWPVKFILVGGQCRATAWRLSSCVGPRTYYISVCDRNLFDLATKFNF